MNTPSGMAPPRQSRNVNRPVAPIVVPPRMHPRQMLRTSQGGLHPVPMSAHHHSYRGPQPFHDPNMRPPFRPPMMPFIPYPIPVGMYPPQVFGRAMHMPALPVHPHTQQVHHVHHHHYHHQSAHHFDSIPTTFERAFPSREAWQRHTQSDTPQVFDPDGHPLSGGDDGGPDIVDVEEAGLQSGMEVVLRNAERHESARYFAARAAGREYQGESQADVAGIDGEQRVETPLEIGFGIESIRRCVEGQPEEVLEDDRTTTRVELDSNSYDPKMQSAPEAGLYDTGRPNVRHADKAPPAGTRACPEASQDVPPRKSRSLAERSLPPQPSLTERDQQRAMSMYSQAIPYPHASLTDDILLSPGPATPPLNTASLIVPPLQSPPLHISPDAMNTAVDRLLETTGLSARQFMQMLEDRAFVGDVERHKVRGDTGQREG